MSYLGIQNHLLALGFGRVTSTIYINKLQGGQLNMAVCFWYLGKSELSSVRVYSSVHWTNQFLQGTRKTRPCRTGHPVATGYDLKHARSLVKNVSYNINIK